MASKKFLVGLPEKFYEPRPQIEDKGRGFKEEERILQILLIKTKLWHLK